MSANKRKKNQDLSSVKRKKSKEMEPSRGFSESSLAFKMPENHLGKVIKQIGKIPANTIDPRISKEMSFLVKLSKLTRQSDGQAVLKLSDLYVNNGRQYDIVQIIDVNVDLEHSEMPMFACLMPPSWVELSTLTGDELLKCVNTPASFEPANLVEIIKSRTGDELDKIAKDLLASTDINSDTEFDIDYIIDRGVNLQIIFALAIFQPIWLERAKIMQFEKHYLDYKQNLRKDRNLENVRERISIMDAFIYTSSKKLKSLRQRAQQSTVKNGDHSKPLASGEAVQNQSEQPTESSVQISNQREAGDVGIGKLNEEVENGSLHQNKQRSVSQSDQGAPSSGGISKMAEANAAGKSNEPAAEREGNEPLAGNGNDDKSGGEPPRSTSNTTTTVNRSPLDGLVRRSQYIFTTTLPDNIYDDGLDDGDLPYSFGL